MNNLTKSFKTKLDKTMKKLDKLYNTINCGGCGIFASELGNVLKQKGLNVKYLLVLKYKPHVEIAQRYARENKILDLNNLHWGHVMVLVDKKLVDSEGVFNKLNERFKSGRKYYGVELPEVTLNEWLTPKYESNWNRTFDRGKLVPKIKKELIKNLVD